MAPVRNFQNNSIFRESKNEIKTQITARRISLRLWQSVGFCCEKRVLILLVAVLRRQTANLKVRMLGWCRQFCCDSFSLVCCRCVLIF